MLWLPIITGVAIVLQGGLNRIVAGDRGLAVALVINAITVLVACVALAVWTNMSHTAPEFLRGSPGWRWWYIVPGICGFIVTLCVPWAIARLGAGAVFAIIIAVQMSSGLAWDAFVEAKPVTLVRAAGAALTALGALTLLR